MKKISTFILAMMLAVSTAISAGAAEFTPSVQGKEAPDLVTTVNEAGEEVVAVVRDAQGALRKEYFNHTNSRPTL